jgi:LmbE family N-acetylglucosaminyl deacetylase
VKKVLAEKKKMLVFAPHPDDETFGCGGTICKKLSEGYDVIIVIMTDGRYSFFVRLGIKTNPTPEELKAIRKSEVKRATKILGVSEENLVFYDFVDGYLEKAEKEAHQKVLETLKAIRPDEVYYPYEKDCHIDHRVTNRIVRSAIKEMDYRPSEYRYSVLRLHAHVGPWIDSFYNYFRHNMILVDVSQFVHLKKEAINEFKSEVSTISDCQVGCRNGNVVKYLKKNEMFFIDR